MTSLPERDDVPVGTSGTMTAGTATAAAPADGAFFVKSDHGRIEVDAEGIRAFGADGSLRTEARSPIVPGYGFTLPGVGRIATPLGRAWESVTRRVAPRQGKTYKTPSDYVAVLQRLVELKGGPPTVEEFAKALGVTPHTVGNNLKKWTKGEIGAWEFVHGDPADPFARPGRRGE